MKGKVILFLVIFTFSISCLPSKSVLAQTTSKQSSNLSIEIYTRDNKGKRPASKTKFYLLDVEVETILSKVGFKEIQPFDLVGTYGMALMRSESSEYKELYKQKYKDFHIAADTALKPHISQSIISDSNGKAQFKSLTPGIYYLFGVAKIKKGISIIRSQVEVKTGENTFTF